MTGVPSERPNIPGAGTRQQRAAELRHELEGQQPGEAGQASDETQTEATPQRQQQEPSPVDQGDYTVRQGDCVASIAKRIGHWSETLLDEPANADVCFVRHGPQCDHEPCGRVRLV